MYPTRPEQPRTKRCDADRPAHHALRSPVPYTRTVPRALPLVAFLFLVALAQAPQRQSGRVVDETGLPVANATVTWTGPAGTEYHTTTDLAGRFVSPPLPPGRYQLRVEAHGFYLLQTSVTIAAAAAPPARLMLAHEHELRQEVSVVGGANPVEPAENTRHETMVAQEIRDIPTPVSHDLRASLTALPNVVEDPQGRVHVAGGRENDTEYTLDGFDISDPIDGSLSANLNIDAVRAADLEPARAGVQYAHAAAGALALRTDMGDDRFRFKTTNFIPGPVLYQGLHFGNWYPRFNVSGPIARGRAWFSDALSLQHTLDIVKELPRNQNMADTWAADNLLRAQWNLTPSQVLQGNFLYNYVNATGDGLGVFTPLSTTTNFGSRRYFVSGRDQVSVGAALLEIGAAGEFEHDAFSPLGDALYVVQPVGASGNYFMSQRRSAHRWQFLESLLVPERQWHGRHDLQFGMNADWLGFQRFAARNPFEIVNQAGAVLQFTTFSGPTFHALADRRAGWYAQDSWQLARWLRLVPAFRYDRSALLAAGLAEPRLAASILPWSDDRAKLTLGLGRYAEPVDLSLYDAGFDQLRTDTFSNQPAIPPGGLVTTTRFFAPPPGVLAPPRFTVASAEWEQRVLPGTYLGLHWLDRREHDGLAFDRVSCAGLGPGLAACGTSPPVNAFLLANGREDRYHSWEVSLRHSFSARAALFGDYVRSRAASNQALDYTLEAPVFAPQSPGPLAWDAPNRFVSWGWAPVPIWGSLLLSYRFEYRTGFPFDVVNDQHLLVGPPGSRRFPGYRDLDLGIERVFPFRHHLWALRLSVINVTNHLNPTAVVNNIDLPNFLTFEGGQGRAFTGRIRLVGASH